MNEERSSHLPTAQAIVGPQMRALEAREWLRVGFFFALGVTLLAIGAALVWWLGLATLGMISPFVVATVLALLLDPLAARLQKRGMSRAAAAGVIFGAFVLLLVGLGFLIVPSLVAQAGQLAQDGPQYIERFKSAADDFLSHHRSIGGYTPPQNFDALFAQLSERASSTVRGSAGQVAGFLVGSVSALLQMVVTLIVTFYLLLDIGRLRARLLYLLPERARGPMTQVSGDIGGVFSDYLRGLLIVCAIYSVVTIVMLYGLSLFEPDVRRYALLVGASAGLLYAVPYVGALVTALATFLICFAAGGAGFGGIAVVLVLNQVFDNVVTPRVIGGGVGLHPVVSVFALVLGGAMFGLWGLLLSVPVAASIQVILFRVFPKLTTPTPETFLQAQGVGAQEAKSAKVMEGKEHHEEQEA